MRKAMHHDAVRFDAPRLHIRNIVHEQHAMAFELKAVRAAKDLGTKPCGRLCEQALRVAVVAAEYASE